MIESKPGPAPIEFTTIIGADAAFKGELSFEKGVRVDGTLEGKINSKGHLAVSQGGKLNGEVHASNVLIEGEVHGNLHATDRVELRKSAKLKGDIRSNKLLVAEGATYVGQCHVGPEAGSAPHAVPPMGTNRMLEKEALPRK